MIKNIVRLELKIGERLYQLYCDHDSPISELKEYLLECLKHLGKIEDQVKAKADKKAEAEKQAEEPKVEELEQPKVE